MKPAVLAALTAVLSAPIAHAECAAPFNQTLKRLHSAETVNLCDVAAGMNAYEAILEALIARGRTGEGAEISVSMFDGMADWMVTPLLQHEGGRPCGQGRRTIPEPLQGAAHVGRCRDGRRVRSSVGTRWV